jgi:nitrogen fixation protein FixH
MMAPRVRTWGREASGWSLLGLAIIFFPLPIIPTVLLLSGLLILSANHAWAGKLVHEAEEKFPSLFRKKSAPIPAKAV